MTAARRYRPDPETLAAASLTDEARFQVRVVALLKRAGFAVYHTHDSRRSEAGFPDLIAIRGERLLAIELKVGRRQLTPDQEAWLRRFSGVKTVEAFALRVRTDGADDLQELADLLTGIPSPEQLHRQRLAEAGQ